MLCAVVINNSFQLISNQHFTICSKEILYTVLEITAGYWPFSNKFQHLADQNLFWLAKFTEHFQWEGHQ